MTDTITDNGDGTFSVTGPDFVDNGDGTFTVTFSEDDGTGPVVITADDVKSWIGNTRDLDVTQLQLCVDSVTALVNVITNETMAPLNARKHGAIMLAARLYSRRGSTSGIQTFDSFGATYISRYDSDIWRLLGLNTIAVG